MSTDPALIAIVGFAAAAVVHAAFLLLILLPRGGRAALPGQTGFGELGPAAGPSATGLDGADGQADALAPVPRPASAAAIAQPRTTDRVARLAFIGAIAASLGWALASLADQFSPYLASRHGAMALDWLRYGLWLLFLLALVRPAALRAGSAAPSPHHLAWHRPGGLAGSAALAWTLGAGLLAAQIAGGWPAASAWWLLAALVLPVIGLVMVEQLFRNLPEDSRWNAKPVCLGLACIFVFDIYHYSEAVLFGRFDVDASHVRGLVHTLALPLIFVATRRRADWIGRLQVSRQAAFYSASLLLVGGYLLFIAGLGYAVRAYGGDWGRALQLALLAGALLLLLVLLLSGAARARLRVFVGKHFFSYRYDYREQWLRFTQMLTAPAATQDVGGLVVRGLADMLESPGGALFSRGLAAGGFVQVSRWNLPAVAETEPADGALARWLLESGWIIDLDEYRDAPKRYGGLALPEWLLEGTRGAAGFWLVIPLIVHDELVGFVVLARPRTAIQMNWETRDLVKTASRQAAGFLAQMQATEALLEARKFDAFNRMSAFVVHDLKNIVTQLSLMLKNAERLHANPEFQQDMLLTVQSSLDKMKRLMLQLREGATPPGASAGVELVPIVERLQAMAQARGRELGLRQLERLATRGHGERLERVLGHLVHNALDATAGGGEVWMAVTREAGQVHVEVGDTGIGMTDEFVRSRLFRPFSSTKASGMGIGMHESLQYVRELGGTIDVDTRAGAGTRVGVRLPLFDLHGSAHAPAGSPAAAAATIDTP
jgi:putative PEP-CTERM system histidine kinase